MDGYGIQKQAILGINDGLLALFRTARSIPGLGDYSFGDWEKTCAGLPAQLAEETIRVAVVGPIKSGKSTFLNSLLKGDFLKRGAGVVTAIVTRVRSGERLKATLYYKSWSEVNEDMEQALVLFPHQSWRSTEERFDIRRERERTGLKLALSALNAEQRISDDARNRNMVLLSCYLQGYDTVSRFLTDQQATRHYENERFIEHWNFSGNEALAVYLRDIQLDINSGSVGSNIEIADCQGSDSSNPLHLAMIQDYLRLAHLLIYVVSSRTGLRRADIKFLSMIKKMGILDNILFVLNCDFSEHHSFADLKSLVGRVSDELSLMKSGADVFAFSALFNLFRSQDGRVSEKDRQRLEHWKSDAEMVGFSDRETERFRSAFDEILSRKRYALLFQNHVERLNAIIAGMSHWTGVNQEHPVARRDQRAADRRAHPAPPGAVCADPGGAAELAFRHRPQGQAGGGDRGQPLPGPGFRRRDEGHQRLYRRAPVRPGDLRRGLAGRRFFPDPVPGVPGVQAGAGRVHHRADQPGDYPVHRLPGDPDPGSARVRRRALQEPDRRRLR